jgi:hypothetical protein
MNERRKLSTLAGGKLNTIRNTIYNKLQQRRMKMKNWATTMAFLELERILRFILELFACGNEKEEISIND